VLVPGPDNEDGEAELRRLCAELRPQLVGALTLHTGERVVAEELAQEAQVRLWQRWPRVRELDSPQAWAAASAPTSSTAAIPPRGCGEPVVAALVAQTINTWYPC